MSSEIVSRSGRPFRKLLLGGTALCAVAVVGMAASADAQVMPTQISSGANLGTGAGGNIDTKFLSGGAVGGGTITYTTNGTLADVNHVKAQTLIDWTTFNVELTPFEH